MSPVNFKCNMLEANGRLFSSPRLSKLFNTLRSPTFIHKDWVMNSPDIGSLVLIFNTRLPGIFIEALSLLLLGTLISASIHVLVNKDDMTRLLRRNALRAT